MSILEAWMREEPPILGKRYSQQWRLLEENPDRWIGFRCSDRLAARRFADAARHRSAYMKPQGWRIRNTYFGDQVSLKLERIEE